jgi:hypothetical protein
MRRAIALLLAALVVTAVAGCGGDETLAPQTPGPPAGMPLPEAPEPPGQDSAEDPAEEDTGTGTGTEEEPIDPGTTDEGEVVPEPTAEPTVEPSGEVPVEPDTAAAPEEAGGGAAAPETAQDGPESDTPPPAGSDAERFEDFCAQNPGAC